MSTKKAPAYLLVNGRFYSIAATLRCQCAKGGQLRTM